MNKTQRGPFSGMKLRQKLMLGFMICIALLSTISVFSLLQIQSFESDMIHLLDSQSLFYDYQMTLSGTVNLLQQSTGSAGDGDLVRQRSLRMLSVAEEMRRIYPGRVMDDLTNSTAAFAQDERIDALSSPDGHMAAASGLKHVLQLIELQFGNVSRTMQEGIAWKRSTVDALMRSNYIIMMIAILIVTTGSVVLSLKWSQEIADPLNTLVDASKAVSWDRFDAVQLPSPAEDDEIGYLMCAFSDMVDRMRRQKELYDEKVRLEQRVTEEHIAALNAQSLLKESELMILQAEINPHFLFNSMNLLRQMAYLEHAPTTGEIVEVLSDMLRYSLSCMHRTSTLAEELENVRNYFYIQNKRFDDAVRFSIEVADERLSNMQLPSMTVQPLVENAYKYCRTLQGMRGEISVRAFSRAGRLVIEVRDNGSGMTQERLQKVREMLNRPEDRETSSHIGLVNVYARLRILFENDVHISIDSEPAVMTRVTLDMPERAREDIPCTAS